MRYLIACVLLVNTAYAGNSCRIINGRQICSPQVANSYIQYSAQPVVAAQQYPVQYYVAPYMQAQAQDAYHFTGSKERLELEYLRGYVVAMQTAMQQQPLEQQAEQQQPEDFDKSQAVRAVPLSQLPLGVQQGAADAAGQIQQQELRDLGVRPQVQMYCARCHNADVQSGGIEIDSNVNMNGPEYDAKRGLIFRALNEGRMPLGADQKPYRLPDAVIHEIMRELSGEPSQQQPQAQQREPQLSVSIK